jgi:hypothetical protein
VAGAAPVLFGVKAATNIAPRCARSAERKESGIVCVWQRSLILAGGRATSRERPPRRALPKGD